MKVHLALSLLLVCLSASAGQPMQLTPEQSAALRPAMAAELRAAEDQPALLEALSIIQTPADSGAARRVEDLVRVAPYRFAGTHAYDRAVQWALAGLKQAGLKNVHTEPVMVPRWLRGCATKSLNLNQRSAGAGTPHCPGGDVSVWIKGDQPEPLTATALGGSTGTPPSGLSAPVLMLDSLAALSAQPLESIKGRIVFFNQRMERRADGSGYGEVQPIRGRGPAEAGRRGAVAVVIRSVGTNRDDVPHTGSTRYDEAAPKIPAIALSDSAADRLEQQLARDPATLLQLRVDARDLGKTRSANVVGEIPGETGEVVLLAAHLDSWDITPGANDDGAGAAIVISALKLLAQSGKKPRRTIRVLLAANEEFGISGAEAYASRHAAEIPKHALAMEADFGSAAVQSLSAGVSAADWLRVQQYAIALQGQGVTLGSNASKGGADLKPLYERGVPVLGPRQDGSLYFDTHHTTQDTLDKLDRVGIEQAVRVYALLTWTAASAGNGFERLPVTGAP